MSNAVDVDHVSKSYRLYRERNQTLKAAITRGRRARWEEMWALRDVSFSVPHGTTFGILGTNGSGKSTLLKCLARILRPERGTISVDGRVGALLELGAGFHPELSGRENVYLNGSILGLSRAEISRRFESIVGFAGLEEFIDVPVKTYSSGMYVRLGFSVAINIDPDVLLIDEVLAVGDESFQRRCAEKISELQREGRTIVIVSHSMGSLQALCGSVAWINNGELAGLGDPPSVIGEYLEMVERGETHQVHGGHGVVLNGMRSQGPDVLPVNGPLSLSIDLHADGTVPVGSVEVTFTRQDGLVLTTQVSDPSDVTFPAEPGPVRLGLTIPRLPFSPGVYHASLSVWSTGRAALLLEAKDAVTFEVCSEGSSPPGAVILPAEWRWLPDGRP